MQNHRRTRSRIIPPAQQVAPAGDSVEFEPDYYELIYSPERGRGLGMSPRRYARAGEENNSAAGVGIIALEGSWIAPGRNRITLKEWSFLEREPEVRDFLKQNIYRLIVPIDRKQTLSDFSEPDALEIIENSYDDEALELELYQETRPRVLKAIKTQINKNKRTLENSQMSLATRG